MTSALGSPARWHNTFSRECFLPTYTHSHTHFREKEKEKRRRKDIIHTNNNDNNNNSNSNRKKNGCIEKAPDFRIATTNKKFGFLFSAGKKEEINLMHFEEIYDFTLILSTIEQFLDA